MRRVTIAIALIAASLGSAAAQHPGWNRDGWQRPPAPQPQWFQPGPSTQWRERLDRERTREVVRERAQDRRDIPQRCRRAGDCR